MWKDYPLSGTPTFFVNGRMIESEEEELGQAVAEALDEARRAMASGAPPGRLYDELQKGARAGGEPTPRVVLPEPVLRKTLQGYGDEVRLVWWDVGDPQRPEARRARRAALAADATPGGFWRMHDTILADLRTDDFRPPPPERLGLPALREGIDLATFD